MPPTEIMETDRVDKLSDKLSNGEQPVPRTALRGNQLDPVVPDWKQLRCGGGSIRADTGTCRLCQSQTARGGAQRALPRHRAFPHLPGLSREVNAPR